MRRPGAQPDATATRTATSSKQATPVGEVLVACLVVAHDGRRAPAAGTGDLAGRRLVIGQRPTIIGRGAPLFEGAALTDPELSRRHLEVKVEAATIRVRDLGSKNGSRVGGAGLTGDWVTVHEGEVLRIGDTLLAAALRPAERPEERPEPSLIGDSDPMRELRSRIHAYAPSSAPVLVIGESGTGKELVAAALAALGRRGKPFVATNLTTAPGDMVGATLFGHTRGAFTGADRSRKGHFLTADGGTLFLDEVGELEPRVQAQLLRVIEEGRVTPIGATAPTPVDVRLVAATHRDLAGAAASGRFRPDLYGRLAQLRLEVPPLRHRIEDVPALAHHFLCAGSDREENLSVYALERLMMHPWPLNVRELKGIVAQALADRPRRLRRRPLELSPAALARLEEHARLFVGSVRESGALDADTIRSVLERTAGNMSRAAILLGKDRGQLYRICKRVGVDAREFRRDSEGER